MESAAAEKMAALKAVYADIILNMARESAARVLASNSRAIRSRQAADAARDEAVAALLRVKSLMDAKIREAEATSLGQLRKIDELEAQLNEAEDTVCSLRADLERANYELAKMKSSIAEPFSGQNTNVHGTNLVDKCQERKNSSDSVTYSPIVSEHMKTFENNTTSSQKTSESHPYSLEHAIQAESMKHSSPENECVSNPDLASIIMRSKEPDLYRNGCTQRIRALEQNLLTTKMPLGQSDDRSSNLKSDSIICENGRVQRPCSIDSAMADEIVTQLKYSDSEETVKHVSSFKNGQVITFPRRARRKRRGKQTDCATIPVQNMADHEPSDTVSYERLEDRNTYERLADHEPSDIPFRQQSSGLSECNKLSVSRQKTTRKSHSDLDEQITEGPLSGTENIRCGNNVEYPLTGIKVGLLTQHAQNIAGNALQEQSLSTTLDQTQHAQNIAGNTLQEQSLSTTLDQNVTENSHVLFCKPNPKMGGVPVINSDSKDEKNCVSNGTSQAGRFLKYTFQRKRKRGSANMEHSSVLVETSDLKRLEDKQNASAEPQKASLVMELPRQDRRLVQVARQLISLSGRRW